MSRVLRMSSRWISACIFFALLFQLNPGQAQTTEAARGVLWLSTQIQADGSLSSGAMSIATPFQASVETGRTLKAYSTAPAALLEHAASDVDNNTEYLARKVGILDESSADAASHIRTLMTRQNADGGFGGAPGYASNVLDTAFALAAFRKSAPGADVAGAAVAYLLRSQQDSGAFAFDRDVPSIYVTAIVSSALQSAPSNLSSQAAVAHANAWLILQKPEERDNVAETSLTQLALVGANSDSQLNTRINSAIMSRQAADGSWGRDPYVTALAVRALMARLGSSASKGSVTGRVINAGTGLPVAGATVTIVDVAGATAISDGNGQYLLRDIAPGTYLIEMNAPGSTAFRQQVSITAGTILDAGAQSLVSAATYAALRGIVKDAGTGTPLAGVLISLTGAASSTVYTQPDGSFNLAGLAPGTVQISVSKTGYASAGAPATLIGGGTLEFNASLVPAEAVASMTGRVVDGITSAPLANVRVSIVALGLAAVSSADGRFILSGIKGGTMKVDLLLAGYADSSFTATSAAPVSIDVGTLALTKGADPSTTATIRGVSLNADTKLPMQGVYVRTAAVGGVWSVTAADGTYVLTGVAPGPVNLSANKTGFVSAGSALTVTAGQTVIFNPMMEIAIPAGVRGQVVDSVTATPLPGVSASVGGIPFATGPDGKFIFTGLSAGQQVLTLSADGYTSRKISFFASTASGVELGAVRLAKRSVNVSVAGRVTDSASFKGIGGASVTILGTQFSAMTDASGQYRIDAVPQGAVSVRFSAEGYLAETSAFELSPYDDTPHDHVLVAGKAATMSLSARTGQPSYRAYVPVDIGVTIDNAGTSSLSAAISVTILDASGQYIESLNANRIDTNGVPQTRFDFVPGSSEVRIDWNPMARAPGRYSAVVRMHQRDPVDAAAPVVELAQQRVDFDIEPTSVIQSVRITPLPEFSNVGAIEQVGYRVDVVNRSNVAVTSKLRFDLFSPLDVSIDSNPLTLDLVPAESTKSFLLQGKSMTFASSGLYPVRVSADAGVTPAALSGAAVSVAPGTRIQAVETLNPKTVAPDGDKNIHIDLRLQGVETK